MKKSRAEIKIQITARFFVQRHADVAVGLSSLEKHSVKPLRFSETLQLIGRLYRDTQNCLFRHLHRRHGCANVLATMVTEGQQYEGSRRPRLTNARQDRMMYDRPKLSQPHHLQLIP
ncbi:hypothetical protein CEXT_371171 [Caerostris extrusa]|uniref:Uncharacterized protein n=1 Tax=Caerostris extrusa TaxID=172846 RepID=A0AAV4N931_CAEEX|nr:hypothetical protein CEXT_371171 [Caerostris extrusa]